MRQWSIGDDVLRTIWSLRKLEGQAYVRVLEKVVAAKQPAAALWLMADYCQYRSSPTLVADAIDRLIGGIEPEELVSFSTWLRAHHSRETSSFRNALGPRDLKRFEGSTRYTKTKNFLNMLAFGSPGHNDRDLIVRFTHFWGFLSMHWNGRVREAALARLGKVDSGLEVPYILMRTNDWVGVVRSRSSRFVIV